MLQSVRVTVLEPVMYIPPPSCDRREALSFSKFQASSSIGAMDEVSREGQKVSTHRGRVLIDVAAYHCNGSARDAEPFTLHTQEYHVSFHWGDGVVSWWGCG